MAKKAIRLRSSKSSKSTRTAKAVAASTSIRQSERALKIARNDADAARYRVYSQHVNKNLVDTRQRNRGWTTAGEPDRDMSSADREKARAKARQKVEESDFVAGIVMSLVDNQVGSGFRLSMRTKDRNYNRNTEGRWALAKDKLDIRGIRRFGRLQRTWQFRKIIDGDVGIHNLEGGMNEDGTVRSFVQTIEADRISKGIDDVDGEGIQFDKFGRPKFYFVSPRKNSTNDKNGTPKKAKRFPADKFSLYAHFPHERVERKRGVSMLLQNLNRFEDLEELINATTQKAKNEAFISLIFKMESAPDGTLFGPEIEETREAEDGKRRRHVKMVPGMNINPQVGEDVEILEGKTPHSEFTPFIRFLLRLSGMPLGLPLEVMLLDFSDTNFSGARGLMELAKKRFRVEQAELAHESSKVFTFWLAREIKHNGLKVPKAVEKAGEAWKHRWGTPGWPYLDPVKEVSAQGMQLDRAFRTLDDILSDTSDFDVEDILDQRSYEIELFKEKGVPIVSGLPGQNIIDMLADATLPKDEED